MDNHSNNPDNHPNNQGIGTEDVDHSGKLTGGLHDAPKFDDGTSLAEAYSRTDDDGNFELVTPDSIAKLAEIERLDEERLKAATAPETAAELTPKSRKALFLGIGAAAVVAVTAFLAIGATNDTTPKTEPVATASGEPGSNEGIKIPAEAEYFVESFGSRYDDPLATYYAEKAFETETGGDVLTVGDDYINTYDFESTVAGGVSPLRFELLSLPYETEINVQSSVDQFNNSLQTMNRAINLIAKNPTSEQLSVLADEFSLYSGYGNEDNAVELITFFQGIVDKYGSNSNYTINPASSETTDTSQATVFDPEMTPVIDSENKDGGVDIFHNYVTLSISVDTYDSENKVATTTDTTDYFSFLVSRAPEGIDPLRGGFVAIGTQLQ